MARPLDPRLLQHARAARGYVLLTAVLGAATAALVVAQALLIARCVAQVFSGTAPGALAPQVWALAGVVAARSGVAWAQDRYGHRAATAVVGQLRSRVLLGATRLGPGALTGQVGASLATLTTRGLDALEGYLTKYLPQLLLTATVTPAVVLVVALHDLVSAATIVVTLPLVPVFMALVGWATQAAADRRLATMQRLGAQVLDLVAGLPTLRAMGRAGAQSRRVREVGDAYRVATMGTLRHAFLSALVLETLTTIAVALVAVGIGLRLVYGQIDLETGLAVLVMAPEAYLPLRMVGVHYHASVDGLAAATQAFEVLDRAAARTVGTVPAPDLARSTVRLQGVSVQHPGRHEPAPHGLDLHLDPGEVVALTGDNGTGKSTAVEVLLGLRAPDAGRAVVEHDGTATDITDLDPATWHRRVAWVPQHPLIVPGTIADNVRLTRPSATDDELRSVAARVGLDEVVAEAPHGWATRVGHGGAGVSAGQRQRIALARALLHEADLVVLDEPGAHLDAGTEQVVLGAVDDLRGRGRTVLLVAHRPTLIAHADRTVTA